MIVQRYFEWAASAPADLRAEAVGALARSYLHGDLEPEVRSGVADVLTCSLDDPALSVRCAIAETFASSPEAPHPIVLSLAQDAADVAEPVLLRSPLLSDRELVDLAAQSVPRAQIAIARRAEVSAPLAAAISEVAGARACEALLRNSGARMTRSAAARIAARHGDDGAVRDALLAHDGAGVELRLILMRSVAAALSSFVTQCGWLGQDRARRTADEACDRGALVIAADAVDAQGFVLKLAERGEFSPVFALRALLCGNLALFEAALAALSGQSSRRVAGFVRDFGGRGFEALYRQAGFPPSALPVFRAALEAGREVGFVGSTAGGLALSRRMVERALSACEGADIEEAPLRALLRRFEAEAAREDARRSFAESRLAVAEAA
ncbi:MAG TPA: DUF2336 domain-containing protein [Hansschlegelia sp.]